MKNCQGYDLGVGLISTSNRNLDVIKRPVQGFDAPITVGWVSKAGHTLSHPAEQFVELLQKYCQDYQDP